MRDDNETIKSEALIAPEVIEDVCRISELYFGTSTDIDQIPINQASADKLLSISPSTLLYKFVGDKPAGWSAVIPTSIYIMNKFLSKEISERELLDIATKEKKYEAIYLCSVFVLPEYRRCGYAEELLIKAIKDLSLGSNSPKLYCWVYSEDGNKLAEHLVNKYKFDLLKRKD